MKTELITSYQQRINELLSQLVADDQERLSSAMRYSLLSKSKRVRPLLVYATGVSLGCSLESLDLAACAVECIHTYSLIHDDLPAMDDDDLRRGQASCHIEFDEATAILAGDALHALAFDVLSHPSDLDGQTQLAMLNELGNACGYKGMANGQALDMQAEGQTVDQAQLERIHYLKTACLIRASVVMAALAAGVDTTTLQQLTRFAEELGVAFQIQDDILDVISDSETLGKPQGSDLEANKATYPSLLGLEASKKLCEQCYQNACSILAHLQLDNSPLQQVSEWLVARNW